MDAGQELVSNDTAGMPVMKSSSNNLYCVNDANRVYDFQSIVTASSLVFGFAVGAPVGIWFVLKQHTTTLRVVTVGCLYGYSLFIFIPATVRT